MLRVEEPLEAAPPAASLTGSKPRLVVISGVTTGIGRALFRAFTREADFCVAGCGRRRELLLSLQAEAGAPHRVTCVDVADDAAVRAWSRELIEAYGMPPAIVIANAGVNPEAAQGRPWAIPADVFEWTMQVNVAGVANLARHFVPAMVEAGTGAFIGISSGSGRSTGPTKGAYSPSKFAVEAFVKCMAQALPPGVVAVPLAPGSLRTAMQPEAPLPTPDEWVDDALPYLLRIIGQPSLSGASLSVPGYYSDDYLAKWIIADGQPLLPEAAGAATVAEMTAPSAEAPSAEASRPAVAEEPLHLCCPITHMLFRDPVFVPESGSTYEREAVLQFWRQSRGQPLRDAFSNMTLTSRTVLTNWGKRRARATAPEHTGTTTQGTTALAHRISPHAHAPSQSTSPHAHAQTQSASRHAHAPTQSTRAAVRHRLTAASAVVPAQARWPRGSRRDAQRDLATCPRGGKGLTTSRRCAHRWPTMSAGAAWLVIYVVGSANWAAAARPGPCCPRGDGMPFGCV